MNNLVKQLRLDAQVEAALNEHLEARELVKWKAADCIERVQARNNLLERVYQCALRLRVRNSVDDFQAAQFERSGALIIDPSAAPLDDITSALDIAIKNAGTSKL